MRLYLFREDTTFLEVGSHAVIGRSKDCAVVIPVSSLSRKHAEVRREGDAYFISDLGSAGGTWIAGLKTKIGRPHRIVDGERYVLGTEEIRAMLRETPLQTPLILALEDEVAAFPADAARRAVWIDALIENGDPLGAWLRDPGRPPPVTERGQAELYWEDGLIRTAVVANPAAGEEVLRSRLASHLLELIVQGGASPVAAQSSFVQRLTQTALPALQHVRLRDFADRPGALPLAPRLKSLES